MTTANPRIDRSPPGQRGFTLIELIAVLAIIGLILAIVVPNIGQHSANSTLAAAARNLASVLRLTRDRAIAQNRPTLFTARDGAFRGAGDSYVRHVPQNVALSFLDGDRRGSAEGVIRFYPDGSSTGGTLALTNAAMRYTVVVAWINGNVTIQSEPANTTR